VAEGETMIHTKKELLKRIDALERRNRDYDNRITYSESNYASNYLVERLDNKIKVLQNILISAGILVDGTGVHDTLIIIDKEPYSIRKVK
jgi:hypothetical protein